jgi:cyanophycin synthetase
LWERTAANVGADFSPIGRGFYEVRRDAKVTFVDSSGAFVDSRLGAKMALDKVLMHRLFESDPGYRAPEYRSYSLGTIHRAYDFLDATPTRVVVKPARNGYAGRGVTAGIDDPRDLRSAAIEAAAFSSDQMVEQHIDGSSYRLLFLDGALIQTLLRRPPHVVGNGRDSVLKLIDAENARRRESAECRSLHPLQPDLDCRLTLRARGLSLSSVPAEGEAVEVKTVVNQSAAEDNEIVSTPVHEDLLDLGARVSALLQLPLVGLDVITEDLAAPLAESGGVVNEINAQPGLHHHYLVCNPEAGVDIAAAVLEYALAHAADDEVRHG